MMRTGAIYETRLGELIHSTNSNISLSTIAAGTCHWVAKRAFDTNILMNLRLAPDHRIAMVMFCSDTFFMPIGISEREYASLLKCRVGSKTAGMVGLDLPMTTAWNCIRPLLISSLAVKTVR